MNEITFGEIRQFMLEILQNIRVELPIDTESTDMYKSRVRFGCETIFIR